MRCLASVLLTVSAPDRPTNWSSWSLSCTRERSDRTAPPSSCSVRARPSPLSRNSLAVLGGSRSVTEKAAARPAVVEAQQRSKRCSKDSDHNRVRPTAEKLQLTVSQAVPVGRWSVVSCPILDAAGLALQPRKGVSLRPDGLRFRAPVGVLFGRRH